jgi:hypothetical protein
MTIEEQAEEYLHEQFLKLRDPLHESNHVPTEEDWQRMPPEVKKQMVDLICGFQANNPVITRIKERLKLRDEELGMYIKRIFK